MLYEASASPDKTFRVIKGATHYYAAQPQQLADVTEYHPTSRPAQASTPRAISMP